MRKYTNIFDAQWSKPLLTADGKYTEYILFSTFNKKIILFNTENKNVESEYQVAHVAKKLLWNPHSTFTNYFLSGHESGYVLYWDKDRKEPAVQIQFSNQISSVKNLAFNPRAERIFACGHEDGKMFVWNMDSISEPNLYFQVDGQSSEGLEWHPTKVGLLMLGTKHIHIVSISGKNHETIQTINCLRGKCSALKWRPGHDNQVSYASESSIIIVDRNRPFLYQYMITIDNGPIQTFEWCKSDTLIIAGKKVVMKSLKEAKRPTTDMRVAM